MFSASWLFTQIVSGESDNYPHGFERRVDLDDAARAVRLSGVPAPAVPLACDAT